MTGSNVRCNAELKVRYETGTIANNKRVGVIIDYKGW